MNEEAVLSIKTGYVLEPLGLAVDGHQVVVGVHHCVCRHTRVR